MARRSSFRLRSLPSRRAEILTEFSPSFLFQPTNPQCRYKYHCASLSHRLAKNSHYDTGDEERESLIVCVVVFCVTPPRPTLRSTAYISAQLVAGSNLVFLWPIVLMKTPRQQQANEAAYEPNQQHCTPGSGGWPTPSNAQQPFAKPGLGR